VGPNVHFYLFLPLSLSFIQFPSISFSLPGDDLPPGIVGTPAATADGLLPHSSGRGDKQRSRARVEVGCPLLEAGTRQGGVRSPPGTAFRGVAPSIWGEVELDLALGDGVAEISEPGSEEADGGPPRVVSALFCSFPNGSSSSARQHVVVRWSRLLRPPTSPTHCFVATRISEALFALILPIQPQIFHFSFSLTRVQA
jgi:hypothetical protein